jgi:hypothetical protein
LDFDTERIQGLIDSIQDYISDKQVDRKIIELNLDECNKSEDEDELVSAGLKVRVIRKHNEKAAKMHNTTSFKEMNSRRDTNNRSVSRHSRPSSQNSMNGTYQSLAFNGVGIGNKHLVCACNGS